jgi:thiamine kinase
MQAESAIESWRQWGGRLCTRPVILGPLSGGLSNRSFLLESGDNKMVLRLNGADSFLPGASRRHESGIWQQASREGLAPPLLYVDGEDRFLVSDYVNNALPPQAPISEGFVAQAFGLLRRCHQLDVDAPSINYASHIKQYWQIIETKDDLHNPALAQQREPMQVLLDELINSDGQTGLCHHDPVIANFVGNSDRLYLIDWEYAAHGLVVMDYAALGVEWGIDDTIIMHRTGFESELLGTAKILYGYLCNLWEEITI